MVSDPLTASREDYPQSSLAGLRTSGPYILYVELSDFH